MNELQKTRTLRMLCVLFAAVILICAVLSPQANAASSASNYENAFSSIVFRLRGSLMLLNEEQNSNA